MVICVCAAGSACDGALGGRLLGDRSSTLHALAAVFATILKYLPMGDNMKVAFGTSVVLAISYATLARKGTSYDNMAEKREAMKNQELADREAARAARAAKAG